MSAVEKTISRARFGTKWVLKKYIKIIQAGLLEREEIINIAVPYHKMNCMLVLTNKRVIKYEIDNPVETEIDSIPLESVISVSIKNDFMLCEIKVKSSNETLKIESIALDIANDFKKSLLDLLK